MNDSGSNTNVAEESWPITMAKVVSCQYQFAKFKDMADDSLTDKSYFLITFSYVVAGEIYLQTYEGHTNYELGHLFQVGYDPSNPQTNTYSEPIQSKRSKILAAAIALGIAALFIYLGEKFDLNDWPK